MLRPQDILLVLKVQASGTSGYAAIGASIGISASQAHAAAKRSTECRLLGEDGRAKPQALYEALLAVKYYFPAKRGGMVRGIPTAHAAPPLKEQISLGDDPIPVWPHAEGTERGIACEPIYKTVPPAALLDEKLYELLALVDVLRIGTAREVELAKIELGRLLGAGP